jgi:hypothetical protein
MILCALGYENTAEASGGYPAGYLAAASRARLNVSGAYNSEASMRDIINLIYKAAETETVGGVSFNTSGVSIGGTGKSVLDIYFNASTVEGIAAANGNTSLTAPDEPGTSLIEVNGQKYRNGDYDGLNDFLGYYVKVYFDKYTQNVISVRADSQKNTVFEIDAEDIIDFSETGNSVNYSRNGGERINEQKIPREINIIYNGMAFKGENASRIFTPDSGSLKFLDNNGDGIFDVLFITERFIYAVKQISEPNGYISDKTGVLPPLDLKDKTYAIKKGGKELTLSKISADDIVIVTADKFLTSTRGEQKFNIPDSENSKLFLLEVVSEKFVSGIFTEFGNDYVSLNGNEYKISKYLKKLLDAKAVDSYDGQNVSVKLYVGLDGNAVYFEYGAAIDMKYGYLVAVSEPKGISNEVSFKVFGQDGKMNVLKLEDKLRVTKAWDGAVDAKNCQAEKISGILKDNADGKINQLIMYSQNDGGKINGLALHTEKAPGTSLSDYKNIFTRVEREGTSLSYQTELSGFSCTYVVNASTALFLIPTSAEADDRYYSIVGAASQYSNDTGYTDTALYDVSPSGIVKAAIKYVPYNPGNLQGTQISLTGRHDAFIFDRLSEAVTETGETAVKLNGWLNGSYVGYALVDRDLIGNRTDNYTSMLKADELKQGDHILIARDQFNAISGFRVIFHNIAQAGANGAPPLDEFWRSGSAISVNQMSWYGNNCQLRGIVDEIVDDVIYLDSGSDYKRRIVKPQYVYLYDVKRQRLSAVDYGSIMTGDYICAYITFGTYKTICVVRN